MVATRALASVRRRCQAGTGMWEIWGENAREGLRRRVPV